VYSRPLDARSHDHEKLDECARYRAFAAGRDGWRLNISARPDLTPQETTMAKGQKRSGREQRKPKAAKAASAAGNSGKNNDYGTRSPAGAAIAAKKKD